jgi:3-methyladenine DNA glycosylase AlkD
MKLFVSRALDELKQLGTPARAKGAAAYFKEYQRLQFFGVDSPTVRHLAAGIKKDEARGWRLGDAIAFTDAMIQQPQLEAKGLGVCVLGKFRHEFKPSMLPRVKRWLAKHCTDWASTDNLCGEVLGPLLVDYPQLVRDVRAWRSSRDLYVRRASAVALIPSVRRGQALDDAYDAARALGGDHHHLLQKAAGWLLREAGKADMSRLERFLRKHGITLSRTTISYAVERFPPRLRRDLMAATKTRPPFRAS